VETTFKELAVQALPKSVLLPKVIFGCNIENLKTIKPRMVVHSEK